MAETPPSLHQYLYAYANPTVMIDPDGNAVQPLFDEKLTEEAFQIQPFGTIDTGSAVADVTLAAGASIANFATAFTNAIFNGLSVPSRIGGALTDRTAAEFDSTVAALIASTGAAAPILQVGSLPFRAPIILSRAPKSGTIQLGENKKSPDTKTELTLEQKNQAVIDAATDSVIADEVAALRSMAARNATPEAQLLHQKINLRGSVADEYARLTNGLSKNQIRNEVGPVLAGVMDTQTGNVYFGLNKGIGELPDNFVSVMSDRMPEARKIPYIKSKGPGTHAEIHALNDAFLARPGAEMSDFLLYTINAGQKGSTVRWGMPVPRCPHCEFITNGVQYFPASLRYKK